MSELSGQSALISAIRRNKWRQGAVFSALTVPSQLLPQLDKDKSHWVLLSHDCDIIHHDLENEPHAEVIALSVNRRRDGNLLYGKNPRRLQIQSDVAGHCFEFHVNSRRFISRRCLADFQPEDAVALSSEQVHALASWIARRYVRTAFPDAFNDRLQPINSELIRVLKGEGEWISGIYVAMELVELPADRPYDVLMTITMLDEDFSVPERRSRVQQTCDIIEALLNGRKHAICIKNVQMLPESKLNLADWRKLRRLEFDYLSAGGDSSPPTPRV